MLTDFIKIPAIRQKMRNEFTKPRVSFPPNLAFTEPRTTNYMQIGTAFDYLFRFLMMRVNTKRNLIHSKWAAESALDLLKLQYGASNPLSQKAESIIANTKLQLTKYLTHENDEMGEDLIISSLIMAQLDDFVRRGRQPNIKSANYDDVEDLRRLIKNTDITKFKAEYQCILNPTFGYGSVVVDGADADLIIDDTIIDIKTSIHLSLKLQDFLQVVGYYLLYKEGGVDGVTDNKSTEIRKVAIYFSRYNYLCTLKLDEIINTQNFDAFSRWFILKAAHKYGHHVEFAE